MVRGARGSPEWGTKNRHPTDSKVSIVKEWDVGEVKAKWQTEEQAAEGLRKIVEGGIQCSVRVDISSGKPEVAIETCEGDNMSNQVQNGEQNGEQAEFWFQEKEQMNRGSEDADWSLDDELFLFGAFPEWGVG